MTTLLIILSTLAAMFTGTLAAPAPDVVCSIAGLPIFRDSTASYAVGTAASDTTLGPPGGPLVGLPGLVSAPWPATFGQVVHVARLSGPDSSRIERAFAGQGSRDVIVVPWSFGAACEPITWRGSARWAPVNLPALYWLHLRPETEWVGGVPVFDALRAELQPYPHGVLAPRPLDGVALTPDEARALYAALPTQREAEAQPAAALRMLDEWAAAHPELAQRFPAAAVLRNARAYLTQRH
jgi:hypothetical protein